MCIITGIFDFYVFLHNRMKKTLLFFLALTLLTGVGCKQVQKQSTSVSTKNPDFGIYLVKNNQLLISQDDVVSYNPDTYTFKLTDEAVKRLDSYSVYGENRTPKMDNGLYQQEFSMMLNDTVLYAGVFWSNVSSLSHEGLVLLDSTMFPTTKELTIAASYPVGGVLSTRQSSLREYFKSIGKLSRTSEVTTTTSAVKDEKILSEKDFNGMGLASGNQNGKEDFFKVQINPTLPVYAFHVASFTATTRGHIEVFKGQETKPIQVINLDPNMWLSDEVPAFFNVQDINFDGVSDMGVVVEGGALWGSYQYWIYDNKTGTFITAPITQDFRKITFNSITFDTNKKQVIASGLIGAVGGYKNIYQFQNGRLKPVEESEHENVVVEDDGVNTQNPTIHCSTIIKKYNGDKVSTTTQVLDRECSPVSFGI